MIWVELGYKFGDEWAAFDYEKALPLLRTLFAGDLFADELTDEKPDRCPNLISHKMVRLSYDEAAALAELGFEMKIKPFPGTMVSKMADRADWDSRPVNPQDLINATAVNISIPDQALLKIDLVTWLEDACTQDLQAHLDDGWRILAVCPPNAARRPDYILGKNRGPF